MYADEPDTSSKFSDAQIIRMLEKAWALVLGEIGRASERLLVVRYNISVVNGTQYYQLPPTIGQILRIHKLESTLGLSEYEFTPASRWNPSGPGYTIEGDILVFTPIPQFTDTLQILFVPKATARLHDGTAGTVAASSIILAASPTTGTLDLRPQAYAGSIVRILNAGNAAAVGQQRIITSYDNSTRTATINPAWTTTPTGTVTYEIAPLIWEPYDTIMAVYAARLMHTTEGDAQRINTINTAYRDMMREIRLSEANVEARMGEYFHHDVPENSNFSLGSI